MTDKLRQAAQMALESLMYLDNTKPEFGVARAAINAANARLG